MEHDISVTFYEYSGSYTTSLYVWKNNKYCKIKSEHNLTEEQAWAEAWRLESIYEITAKSRTVNKHWKVVA